MKTSISNETMTRKILLCLAVVITVMISVFLGLRAKEIWGNINGNYPRELNVNGEGRAYAVPDVAIINLGMTAEAENSQDVITVGTEKMNGIMEAIRTVIMDNRDIQTTNYYLNPKYDWIEGKGNVQNGYRFDQNVTVKVRNFEKLGTLLEIASKAGANTIGTVSFYVENTEKVLATAREAAIKNANENAAKISKQTGLKLGKILYYNEYQNQEPNYYGKGDRGMGGGGGGESMEYSAGTQGIEPGQNEFIMVVNMNFRIR